MGRVRSDDDPAGDEEARIAAKRDMGIDVTTHQLHHQPGYCNADVHSIGPLNRWHPFKGDRATSVIS